MKLEILGKLEDYLKVKGIAEVNTALTKLGAKAKYRLLVNGFQRHGVFVRVDRSYGRHLDSIFAKWLKLFCCE